jgi:hypothetical protein
VSGTVPAGLFLFAFGAAGAWFLGARFPQAKFLRAGYALMALGGLTFVAWGVWKVAVVGIAAAALLGAGGASGALGALRRELRLS